VNKDIGLGIIGLGMGSGNLKLNEREDSRFKVRGICSARSKEKARSILEKWNVNFYTNDYKELVKRKDIDVVGVYSPNNLHAIHCEAALKAGKHVVCTKPLTENLEDAIQLVNLVKKTGLKFLVGQTLRFEPQTTALRRFYDDGEIGEIIFAEAHYIHDSRTVFKATPWRETQKLNPIYGGMCHPIDGLRWFLGDIDEVHAYSAVGGVTIYADPPEMNNFIINIKFKNGVIARALGLFDLVEPPEPMMKLSVFGRKGSGISTHTDNKGGSLDFVYDKVEHKPVSHMEFPPEPGIDIYGHTKTIGRYMDHFEDCIINDKEPSPNVIDGAKTISAGNAAYKSIKNGKAEKVFNEF